MAGVKKTEIAQSGGDQVEFSAEEDAEEEEDEGPTLSKQFVAFVKYKQAENKGTHILLSQSDFWMTQAEVIQGRELTTTDTGVCFFRFKKYKLDFQEYEQFLSALAAYKKIPLEEIIYKLVNCGLPPEETKKIGPQKR